MLRTPATTCRSVPATSMRTRQSRSESGWSATSSTLAITTPSRPSHGRSMDSVCMPFAESSSPSASAERSTGQSSRSHESTTFTASPARLELLEEPDVVLPQDPDVGDAEPDHGEPVVAAPEREPGPSLRVVADGLQHARMHHAGAHRLDPAREATRPAAAATADEARHLNLRARLDERKERRREADLAFRAEQLPVERLERPSEVGEGDALVDREPFDLVEHRHVLRG